MNGYSKIKSFAKINLALNIVGKSLLLHKIESIISFLSISDEIKIKEIYKKKHLNPIYRFILYFLRRRGLNLRVNLTSYTSKVLTSRPREPRDDIFY